jgi:hypothetical protein
MVDASKVVKVYSGRPGCACGCRGNYSTNPKTIKLITRRINEILTMLNGELKKGGYETYAVDGHFIAAENGHRAYTAYYQE